MVVFYIDDDSDDVAFFLEALSKLDTRHKFLFAENGKEGIDALAKIDPPDYIFLDINMPIMNGKETLKAIRSDPRLDRSTVIMLSTVISQHEVNELSQSGAHKCLIKPISPKQLRTDLDRILTGK